MFDDDQWIRSLTDAEAITADILERQVTYVAQGDTSQNQGVEPPVQMGDFVRRCVSRRLLALNKGEDGGEAKWVREEERRLWQSSSSL